MVVGHVDALADSQVWLEERGGLVSILEDGRQLFIVALLKFRI